MIDQIYEGIYPHLKDVPVSGAGFSGSEWLAKSSVKILDMLEKAKAPSTVPSVAAFNSGLLPMVVAMAADQHSTVKVLDFGGGPGFGYVPVISAIEGSRSVEYHVVEMDGVCELGERVFQDDSRIYFHSSLPNDITNVDVVHLGTSLQYIEDWKGLLSELAGYLPRYYLFDDLQAGDIPTYATSQTYYGSKIPCWFFNVQEILDAMTDLGFDLLFKSTYLATILGHQQEIPQANFPEEYRLGHACSLLFRPIDGSMPENPDVS